MLDLTDRQIQIIKAIVEEYINTAEPVSSATLEKNYNFGISPATIRNEMAELIDKGFLRQPHTSAGRVPTPLALKFYVGNLMKAKEMSIADEVGIKERVWDYRQEFDKLLRESTRELAEKTKTLAVATTSGGDVYYAGAANLLDMPEFFDIDLTRTILTLLDHFDSLEKIFGRAQGTDQVHLLIGEEMGYAALATCGIIFTHYDAGAKHKGAIGVIGPIRLNYPYLIPRIKYFGTLISEIAIKW